MTEAYWILIAVIILLLWIMGIIRVTPNTSGRAKRDLANTLIKGDQTLNFIKGFKK